MLPSESFVLLWKQKNSVRIFVESTQELGKVLGYTLKEALVQRRRWQESSPLREKWKTEGFWWEEKNTTLK